MSGDHVLAGYRVATRAADLPGADLVSMSHCVVDLSPTEPDGWDEWFTDLQAARRTAAAAGRHVVAVGFAAEDVPALLDDVATGWDATHGNLADRLRRGEPLPTGFEPLGFELVGYDTGTWHTWTCLGGLVEDVRVATGIRPGRWGLIQDGRAARTAADWLTASGLGDPKVFLWVPALLLG
jgi:hypothetical protein